MIIVGGSTTGTGADVDTTSKALRNALYDQNGNPIARVPASAMAATDRVLPIGGVNDGVFRGFRSDRIGGIALSKFTPVINYQLYTAALMPTWLAPANTFTISHSVSTGTFLNAAATGAVSSNATLVSMASVTKYQKNPIHFRARQRVVKGSTNGLADWGFSSTQAPASVVHPNGFVFLYGSDGTLKPTIYSNSSVIVQGTDFASSVNSANYYVWDIIVDDDNVVFVCQDSTTGLTISEQVLRINVGDPRFGISPFFFPFSRVWTTSGAANVGTATQLYVADISIGVLDLDISKPWAHIQAGQGNGGIINPTIAIAQMSNYSNSAAPASATLSNTAAGYTTLGGQFQFAAAAGAETDYALFAWTVPTGLRFNCTDISIDTMNTGAAVATTETWLQWFASPDSLAVTLASNNFRIGLGNQVFAIGAAIGAQATPLVRTFQTPLVTNSGRIFQIALKIPRGTATASQVVRGLVNIGGYFD